MDIFGWYRNSLTTKFYLSVFRNAAEYESLKTEIFLKKKQQKQTNKKHYKIPSRRKKIFYMQFQF